MTTSQISVSRRTLLGAAAGAGAFAAAGGVSLVSSPAQAAVAKAGKPMAGALRYKVGDLEITALLDGYLDVTPELVIGYEASEGQRLRDAAMVEGDALRIPVNAYLVNTGDRLILVDAGTSDALGPTMGRLPDALAAAGVTPDQVDALLITHMHPDHLFGVIDGDGNKVFKNAELILPEVDKAFWFDDAAMNGAPEQFKPFFVGARKAAEAYKDSQTLISGDKEILPGIRSMALPGHTPGHTGYLFDSNGETLVIAGDIVHMAVYQFSRPDWGIGFDIDPGQAVTTRKAFLDQAAADKLFFAGAHIPFPGMGRVAKDGEGYRFVAANWPYAY
ncbi:metallo-beta-lactamase family protein [Stappia aggregata IAM 12614]|uniref:Metallo-beta-lactamase family protein n=1 Tax=Roseibium aggregatum (strain ATCC 25650 / DSM 13394 / JCM 20685 / NBRC 16684 / NCIMB 2208 / IAM 12614 / B1) TaxID=384765 RepID=A0NTY0_ROSAI|nr:MBL fold metallo-hydrolase [Roseibium aggregatum]EAV43889.1 metallo-beta-lactamase family protein [Stappia aggregata IAM 12614] [Roseibium aggregatum IAM 12614]